jgi:hypothetical protein
MSSAAAVEIQGPRGIRQAVDWAYQRGGGAGGAVEVPAVGVACSGMANVGAAGADVTNSRSTLALATTRALTRDGVRINCIEGRAEPENVLTSGRRRYSWIERVDVGRVLIRFTAGVCESWATLLPIY